MKTSEYKADGKTLKGPVKKGYHRGRTVVGGVEIDVADGTPVSCDPTCETYWSM